MSLILSPNILSTMIVTAATDIATMMLELAALSFLGFGAQAPTPEWGLMLNEGRTYLVKAPWLMIYPGVAIMIVVVVFNMLGDSMLGNIYLVIIFLFLVPITYAASIY